MRLRGLGLRVEKGFKDLGLRLRVLGLRVEVKLRARVEL